MTFELSQSGKFKITMFKDIHFILKEDMCNMDGKATSLATNNLLEVRYGTEDITLEEKSMYANFVGKLLLLCCRARPDI